MGVMCLRWLCSRRVLDDGGCGADEIIMTSIMKAMLLLLWLSFIFSFHCS